VSVYVLQVLEVLEVLSFGAHLIKYGDMLSNGSLINTTFPLISGASMPLTINTRAADHSLGNGFNELMQLTKNFTQVWAPAALLNIDSSLNTTLLNNSSDSWNTSFHLVDCLSVKCFNYTENEINPIVDQRGVDSTKTFDISSDISSNRGPDYVLDNETISSTTIATLLSTNGSKITTIILEPDLRIHHPFLAVFLAIICVVVVFGNTLTMLSVYRERYLHTVTNYFVASLAVSDCLVGAIVMPFSVIHEIMNKWWIFGQDW
jgi:hypothetical protein